MSSVRQLAQRKRRINEAEMGFKHSLDTQEGVSFSMLHLE